MVAGKYSSVYSMYHPIEFSRHYVFPKKLCMYTFLRAHPVTMCSAAVLQTERRTDTDQTTGSVRQRKGYSLLRVLNISMVLYTYQRQHVILYFLIQVPHTDDGLEAIIFTAQGDMRQVHIYGLAFFFSFLADIQ